jgi:DNA-binding transcriptional ArsR family regulator
MQVLHHPDRADLDLASVLDALGDPVRLQLVARLAACDELTCAPEGFGVEVHKSTLSHHFRVLREAGVTRTRVEGRNRFMRLRREDLEERFPGLLDAVLASSPR